MINIKDIKDYFRIDVTGQGVSNKFIVVLRSMGCVVILYSAIMAIFSACIHQNELVMMFALLGIIYLALLHLGKKISPLGKIISISAVDMISVIVGYIILGPRAVFQIYLVILIILTYFFNYGFYLRKTLYSLMVGLLYVGLTLVSSDYQPMIALSIRNYMVIQVANIVCSIVCITIMCTIYSMDSHQLEGKLVEFNKKLQKQATTDPLTGLRNRRSAMDFIEELADDSDGKGFCVCMSDIDFSRRLMIHTDMTLVIMF